MAMSFLGPNVNAAGSVPYQRIIEPSQLGMYLNLEQAELLRIRRYHEHWRFYIGQHWTFTREDGEPLVTINYARKVVDKHVSWLVGAGMTISVPQAMRNHTLPILEEVWDYNLRQQLLYKMALMGGVTGDVFVLVTYEAASAQAQRINPHTKGHIRIQLLGSEQVYPQWDPLNKDVLVAVRIETIYYDDRVDAWNDGLDHQGRQLHTRRFSQTITRDEIIEQYQGQEAVRKPNWLGEIPLIHIANQPVPDEYYGLSDLEGVIELNRELNEKATDISDIINYHASPITVVKGAKVKSLERSPKNIWSGLPPDADVFNLEMSTDLNALINYFKLIKEAMLEVADVPEGSLGKQQPISNTSGVALHTQYQPIVERTAKKRAFYEPALVDINYFILRIAELTDPTLEMPTDLCKHCGGRIVEVLSPSTNRRKKKCYRIDGQTFEFLKPGDVEVKTIRQHSFGQSVEELPYDQVRREHGRASASEWDPEPEESAETRHARATQVDQPQLPVGEDGTGQQPAPPAPPYTPPQLNRVELPPEPELITLRTYRMNQAGTDYEHVGDQQVEVVPTGCKRPQYLNPYATEVVLNDTIPKDKQLQAQLFGIYQNNGWVSKVWCREQVTDIEDPEQEKQRIADEKAETPVPPAAGKPPKRDELDRTVGPPFAANLPTEE